MEQRRHEECALARIGIDDVEIVAVAEHDLGLLCQFAHAIANLVTLSLACECAHVYVTAARVADADVAEGLAERLGQLSGNRCRRQDTPYGRALLAGLAGHLAHDLLDEKIELGRAGERVGAEYRGIQRVCLGREGDRFADDAWMSLQEFCRRLRAREGNRVLTIQVVEQVAEPAADQLQRAFGKNAGLMYVAHHELGQVGRAGCGLDDGGHARE